VNVLHHHLETVEATSFGELDLSAESLSEVLENDTVRGSEESENVLDKMLFIFVKLLPVFGINGEINLIHGPEACHLILVHLPNIMVMNRQDDKTVGVFLKKWLWERSLSLSVI